MVKFERTPSQKSFGGPGFDPKPSECTQFTPNQFELCLYYNPFSYRRHFFQPGQFEDIQAFVNCANELTDLRCLKYTLNENLNTGCSSGDGLTLRHGKMY